MNKHARLWVVTGLTFALACAALEGCSGSNKKKVTGPGSDAGMAGEAGTTNGGSAGAAQGGTGNGGSAGEIGTSEAGTTSGGAGGDAEGGAGPIVTAPAAGLESCYGTGPSGGWCWQNRIPASVTLYGGAAANADTAWAIGELGVVVKTNDGGATWQRVRGNDGTGGFFKSMSAVDSNTVWAAGAGGQIIKTVDGGKIWTKQTSGSSNILNDVVANSASVAWAVGVDAALRTSDGGSTWQKLTTLAAPLYRLSAPTSAIAYVTIQPDSVARTSDSGVTWATTQLVGLAGSLATAISAPSAGVAWVVGQNGLVERTTDGATWSNTSKPKQGTASPLSILAFNALTAYISYDDATIAQTTDGGVSWSLFAGNRFSPTEALFAADANTLWGVGVVGAILHSTDAGATWSEQSRGPRLPLLSVAAVDANTAWTAGFGCVISRTTDAGASWPLVRDDSAFLTPSDEGACEVSSVSATSAWAAGGFGDLVIKTSDGGTTWQPGYASAGVTTVTVVDPNTVWIGGPNGFIAKTVNAGAMWTTQNSGTTRRIFKVYALDAQVAYAAFDDGSVRRTGDGGVTWTPAVGFNNQHTAIVPLDADRVVSVELKGVIRRSVDGGATFTPVASGTIEDLDSATRAQGDTLFAAGMFQMLRSDDAGLSWRSQPLPPFETGIIEGISAIDAKRVWAVSYNGSIIHTSDGGD